MRLNNVICECLFRLFVPALLQDRKEDGEGRRFAYRCMMQAHRMSPSESCTEENNR